MPKSNTAKPKTKFTAFRWQDIDFNFAFKQATKQGISMSEYLRKLVTNERNKYEKIN